LAANFFNSFGPFDGIKRDLWEGGFRVPTIAWWPGHIPAGRIAFEPSQSQDWMATFAELAGVPSPARCDGVSLVPSLTRHGQQRPSTIYSEYFNDGKTPDYPQFAPERRGRTRDEMQTIRIGDYEGVRYEITSQSNNFEIYNMRTDFAERTNLASNPDFSKLQQQMKDTVLRLRRPDHGAKRPYDKELVPAEEPFKRNAGVTWSVYERSFPWLPELTDFKATSTGTTNAPTISVRSRDNDVGILFTGYINVPEDGDYTFYLTADTSALLRIHEATVIDEDFDYPGMKETSGAIRLKAGAHPFRLYYARRDKGAPHLEFAWSGPGFNKEPLRDTAFFH
jgi:hypothetical protein